MKKCPYCAEEIQNDALKCKHCASKLDGVQIDEGQVWTVLADLINNAELIRWTRLYNLLVVNTLLILAWAAIFSSDYCSSVKPILLLIMAIPGTLFSLLWSGLGSRSSGYLDDYHEEAWKIEERFPEGIARPFHESEKRRSTVRRNFLRKLTSSRWLVTWIPIVFAVVFVALIVISLL